MNSTLKQRKVTPNPNPDITNNNNFTHSVEVDKNNINSNIIDFFQVKSSRDIIWSHATNSAYKLAVALASKCHMIEADILMGTCPSHPATIAIMSHPPHKRSDISFEDFILSIHNANKTFIGKGDQYLKKGVKLDFKDPDSLVPCLKFLKALNFDAPIFINADIWRGLGGKKCEFLPKNFFKACKLFLPNATISIGWKVGKSYKLLCKCAGYTMKQVDQAIADIDDAYPLLNDGNKNNMKRPHITFPLQTLMARQSNDDVIIKLLNVGSITFWGEARDEDVEWTHTLNGIIYMDTLEPSLQAKYLITYALPVLLTGCGVFALTMIFQMFGNVGQFS